MLEYAPEYEPKLFIIKKIKKTQTKNTLLACKGINCEQQKSQTETLLARKSINYER